MDQKDCDYCGASHTPLKSALYASFLKDTYSLRDRINPNSQLMLQLHLISSKFKHLIAETSNRQSLTLILLLNLIPSKLRSAVLHHRYLEAFEPKAREQL